jgi:ketosteroid isomerase-like protein
LIFGTLNARDYSSILDIYAKNAVLVTPKKTIQGEENIKAFYEQVIAVELKKGDFRVTYKKIIDNTIHYRWTCTSQTGNVVNGKDTLGIRNNKVIYHYCFYSIT